MVTRGLRHPGTLEHHPGSQEQHPWAAGRMGGGLEPRPQGSGRDDQPATGNIGHKEEAAGLAARAWEAYPAAEAAREIARWLSKLGRDSEAIERYADALASAVSG